MIAHLIHPPHGARRTAFSVHSSSTDANEHTAVCFVHLRGWFGTSLFNSPRRITKYMSARWRTLGIHLRPRTSVKTLLPREGSAQCFLGRGHLTHRSFGSSSWCSGWVVDSEPEITIADHAEAFESHRGTNASESYRTYRSR